LERYLQILNIALEAVFANRFRSILTALGIIFGVAAVIAMMAIGNGAQQEILDQMKLVGVNNIIITPIIEKSSGNGDADETQESNTSNDKYSPGLSIKDALSIKEMIPTVNMVSPEVIYETFIIKDGIRSAATLTGVTPDFFKVFNLDLHKGHMFSEEQMENGSAVCIIGPAIESKFFPQENPVGKYIKSGNLWLKVIGVVENRNVSSTSSEELGISSSNANIFAPIQTIFLRYKDRSVITEAAIRGGSSNMFFGDGFVSFSSGSSADESSNYHQIDKIVVQVKESIKVNATVKVLQEMLLRRHAKVNDFEIRIPELLLKQEQRTKDIFNIVLGAIASISLIVGGIGIMNIMLASVMERIREIGVRMATGATKKDIVFQFLAEATLISISGGLIGIILGLTLSKVIMQFTDILTIVSPMSIAVSFGVSVAVGILFGYMPAKRASEQDPVESLRHD